MYKISNECVKYGACSPVCPIDAVSECDDQYVIDDKCVDCSSCAVVCPVSVISLGE